MKPIVYIGIALAGLVVGSIAGSLFNTGTCCQALAAGIRAKFPASVQGVGDTLHVWPITIGLANFA